MAGGYSALGESAGGADLGDEPTGVIIHEVAPAGRHRWTHIDDLDSFFTRMYRYYLKGGFVAMLVSDCLQLMQYCFVVFFITFLVHCVNYPLLFRHDVAPLDFAANNLTFADLVYDDCPSRVSVRWWLLVGLCSVVGLVKLTRCVYHLYHAYDTKLFYNTQLCIDDSELCWLSWNSVQARVRDAQRVLQMCIHKQQITELDIYHRILRFDNYMVAMVNKRLLPLYVSVPFVGDIPYLSKGLKYNLELLLFYGPWSPWENCWQLRECYKDASKRLLLAKQLKQHIAILSVLNLLMAPLIFTWQILYYFFNYAELIKRSPESLGLRTWSLYARILLRHFNELDHEFSDRLSRAHKPATKYLTSFPSPISSLIAKNIAFVCASFLGVIICLSLYDEVVLNVEHMLTAITVLGCTIAVARSFIPEEETKRSSEELLVQVLGHVHYLPATWRGKAHTKHVAAHFQQLFQFRATYILIELISPLISPFILLFLRSRALDIVDFYRNFTVSVLDIGDVCAFAQMDVRRHGNPEWSVKNVSDENAQENITQYNQGEDGKTELSLVAFSCRNPGWRIPHANQKKYLSALHNSVMNATNNYNSINPLAQNNIYKTMLSSYYNQNHYGLSNPPTMRSGLFANNPRCSDDDLPEEQDVRTAVAGPSNENRPLVPDRIESSTQEEQDLSISTIHLYDLHLARIGQRSIRRNPNESSHNVINLENRATVHRSNTNEGTPLLKKTQP